MIILRKPAAKEGKFLVQGSHSWKITSKIKIDFLIPKLTPYPVYQIKHLCVPNTLSFCLSIFLPKTQGSSLIPVFLYPLRVINHLILLHCLQNGSRAWLVSPSSIGLILIPAPVTADRSPSVSFQLISVQSCLQHSIFLCSHQSELIKHKS